MDFIRTRKDASLKPWTVCIGGEDYDGFYCPEPNITSVRGKYHIAECFLEDLNGQVISSSCSSGEIAPVMVFRWSNINNPAAGSIVVEQRWRLDGEGLSHQPRLSGTASGGLGHINLKSPIIVGLGRDPFNGTISEKEVSAILPYRAGVKLDTKFTLLPRGATLRYPSTSMGMQFVGYMQGDRGFYVGVHDPLFKPKLVRVLEPYTEVVAYQKSDFFYVGHFPINPGTPNASDINNTWWIEFKHVNTTDGWISIAYEYRNWINSIKSYPLLLDRADLPQNLRDGVYWIIVNLGQPGGETRLQELTDLAKESFPGKEFGIHLYNWYTPGFDKGGGSIIDGGFTLKNSSFGNISGLVSNLESEGHIVVPYINPRNADLTDHEINFSDYYFSATGKPYRPTYGVYSEVKDFICKNPRGDNQTFPYNGWYFITQSGTALGLMDDSTSFWKGRIDLMWDSVRGLGTKGVYLDTVGSVTYGCWDPRPGRPTGFGEHVVNSQRDIIRDRAPPYTDDGVFVSAEHYTDAFIDEIDLFYYYGDSFPSFIPLYNAVYNDVQITVGPRIGRDDTDTGYFYKNAMATIGGYQIGISADYLGDQNNRINYTTDLIDARMSLKDFLSYGVYRGEAEYGVLGISEIVTIGNAPYPNCTEGCWCLEGNTCDPHQAIFNSVIGSYWSSYSGEDVLIYTNPNNDSFHQAYFEIPSWLRGYDALDCNFDGTDCLDASENFVSSGAEINLSVAPQDIRVIYFTEPPSTSGSSGNGGSSGSSGSSSGGGSSGVSPGELFITSGGVRIDMDQNYYVRSTVEFIDSIYLDYSNKLYSLIVSQETLNSIRVSIDSGDRSFTILSETNVSYDIDLVPGDDLIFGFESFPNGSLDFHVWRVNPVVLDREYPSLGSEISEPVLENGNLKPGWILILLTIVIISFAVYISFKHFGKNPLKVQNLNIEDSGKQAFKKNYLKDINS